MDITKEMLERINKTAVHAGLAIMKIYGEYLRAAESVDACTSGESKGAEVVEKEAGQAGEAARQAIHLEYKEGKMPLTAADKASNAVIVEDLKRYFPECAVLSEEEKDDRSRLDNPYCFVVDPLDGTKEFIKRNGQFTVNIALSENHTSVLGVIYVPVSGELYYAAKGMGARLVTLDAGKLQKMYEGEICGEKDTEEAVSEKAGPSDAAGEKSGKGTVSGKERPLGETEERKGNIRRIERAIEEELNRLTPAELHVSGRKKDLRVVMSSSHGCEEMDRLLEKYNLTNFVKMGSSLKGCVIAKGEAEIYYRHNPTMEWDTAAMQCIVEEAGAIFRQMDDTKMCYNREDSLNAKGFYIINCEENKLV